MSQVRVLKQEQLIAVLPSTADERGQALNELAPMLNLFDSPESMARRVEAGLALSATVSRAGERIGVLFYAWDQATLAISFAEVSLDRKHDHFAEFIEAAESIACQLGAKWIHFNTRRAGLVRKAARHGYTPDTVNLVKRL
jgi:hypothetical protein